MVFESDLLRDFTFDNSLRATIQSVGSCEVAVREASEGEHRPPPLRVLPAGLVFSVLLLAMIALDVVAWVTSVACVDVGKITVSAIIYHTLSLFLVGELHYEEKLEEKGC